MLLLLVQSGAAAITLRPNTRMEFASLSCAGEYNKAEYRDLSRVCEDCYNLFREIYVFSSCKSNCFRNEMFPKCVSYLLLDNRMGDFVRKISLASGDR
ncbi:crustacean hyperglycemic hormone [Hyalella azteca]|uniref:Crustacean hyperglycemic hormone n=1 Tax=Hyalella azteca TaxID=294128 RepID=A0A8B7NQ51_HYAAZ|nr:crustacean hyperglycemic hormone [Hyalella azteca]